MTQGLKRSGGWAASRKENHENPWLLKKKEGKKKRTSSFGRLSEF